jgi:hypothetical protein
MSPMIHSCQSESIVCELSDIDANPVAQASACGVFSPGKDKPRQAEELAENPKFCHSEVAAATSE